MKLKLLIVLALVLILGFKLVFNHSKSKNELNCMFYNLENFYDTINDTQHFDDEYLPNGRLFWNTEKYNAKIKNLSKVIHESKESPDILGVCELESKVALKDLLLDERFKNQYQMVHYDSKDERGIDVALIYNTEKIKVLYSKPLYVRLSKNKKDRTRDILYVKSLVLKSKDTLNILVCHFPSRREGKEKSEINRIDVAKTAKKWMDSIGLSKNWMVMGDFNDEPNDISITEYLKANKQNSNDMGLRLHNLMWDLMEDGKGSYNYNKKWQIIDQMMLSSSLLNKKGLDYEPESVEIIKKDWMMQTGKYKNFPKRNFVGNQWKNGYSDHLPIFIKLNI